MQHKNGPLGIEITLITDQIMNGQEEDILTMAVRNHEAGTEKNAEKEKEMLTGNGPGEPRLLREEARSHH